VIAFSFGSAPPSLALDDVVDLDQLRLRGLDRHVGQYRHETLSGRFELLTGLPDLGGSGVPPTAA
jgi:hypothetical protein